MFTLTELGPKDAEMRIIGCDSHARQRTLAMLGQIETRSKDYERAVVVEAQKVKLSTH